MKTSTTKDKLKTFLIKGGAISFWIIIWQLIVNIVKLEILVVSPAIVALTLFNLVLTKEFWAVVFFSFFKIISGFFIGVFLGVILAWVSIKSKIIKELLSPIVTIIKATPVASFIILALLWIKSSNLSVFISFLMVFPIIYTSTYQGLVSRDIKLEQMAEIFNISAKNKAFYITLPQVMPYFISACSVALGMCWKAGIAAEVIATPNGTIGDKLYRAKLYLNTPELFAWTIVIIVLSLSFEKLFIKLVKTINKRLGE